MRRKDERTGKVEAGTARTKSGEGPKRRESKAERRARAEEIVARLNTTYQDARCSLDHGNVFELLIATILSAQCTDARVNMVTPELFARGSNPKEMIAIPEDELLHLIHSTGFFRSKAKSIRGACEALIERFGGAVPRTMDDLLTLRGVARKTANVVLGSGFGIAAGVVVDTHVQRITRLLGLTKATDPKKIEWDLQALIPRESWTAFSHQLVYHGRAVCIANRPRCEDCVLKQVCPSRREEPRIEARARATAAPKPRRPRPPSKSRS